MRERAVRMVFEHQGEYPSQWKAIESISEKLSINHETLRQWVRRAETDAGERPGLTTDERVRMRELEREVKELRRANEILKSAAVFFGAELDRRQPRFATLGYIDWFNHRRLHGEITDDNSYTTPAEFEATYYRQNQPGLELLTQ